MNPLVAFWLIFGVLFFAILYFDRKFGMLRDSSVAKPQPYSWARVQLAWWSVIVLSSFIAIMIKFGLAPTLNESTVILIGISAATIATARVIDISDAKEPNIVRHQDNKATNLFVDILSDNTGPSIHRFQTLVFNIAFGVYFIFYVLTHIKEYPIEKIDEIMPLITTNNLILLGLSSATYAAMKFTENKTEDKGLKINAADEGVVNVVADEPAVG